MKKILALTLIICLVVASYVSAAAIHEYANNLLVKGELRVNSTLKRVAGDRNYSMLITDGGFATAPSGQLTKGGSLIGTAAQKNYGLGILVSRDTGKVATGDSNDAGLLISTKNYADNDTNFIFRGINATVSNRQDGQVGILENTITSLNRVGNAPTVNTLAPTIRGLQVSAENFGLCTTEFGGVDVIVKNEGLVATTEYGVRIRNVNNSLATAVDAAIIIQDTGANTGWTRGIDMSGATIGISQIEFSNGAEFYVGAQTTRNAVRTEVGTQGAIGSMYSSSAGKLYLKVNTAGADTDWELVTTSAAD